MNDYYPLAFEPVLPEKQCFEGLRVMYDLFHDSEFQPPVETYVGFESKAIGSRFDPKPQKSLFLPVLSLANHTIASN
jgi:hypothetical protein